MLSFAFSETSCRVEIFHCVRSAPSFALTFTSDFLLYFRSRKTVYTQEEIEEKLLQEKLWIPLASILDSNEFKLVHDRFILIFTQRGDFVWCILSIWLGYAQLKFLNILARSTHVFQIKKLWNVWNSTQKTKNLSPKRVFKQRALLSIRTQSDDDNTKRSEGKFIMIRSHSPLPRNNWTE